MDTTTSEANLTVSDAVRITSLSADTIRRYSNDGKLRTFRTPANHRRFTEEDVRALIHETSPVESTSPTPDSTAPQAPAGSPLTREPAGASLREDGAA
jgi:excisionase family DNA binding protein